MSKKFAVRTSVLALLVAVVAFNTACPAKDAAVAVNKYLTLLSTLQDGEIVAHKDKSVSDDFHVKFQKAIKDANQGGNELNRGVIVAAKGGDPTGYIDVADSSYEDLLNLVGQSNNAALKATGKLASDAIKNAITLIKQIKANAPPPPMPAVTGKNVSPVAPHGSLRWMFAMMALGLAGMAITPEGVDTIVSLVTDLEPVAFNAVVNFIQSLKSKSVDEVTAMNQELIDKIDSTADAEIAAAGGASGTGASGTLGTSANEASPEAK